MNALIASLGETRLRVPSRPKLLIKASVRKRVDLDHVHELRSPGHCPRKAHSRLGSIERHPSRHLRLWV